MSKSRSKSIEDYKVKRDFEKTPEPAPGETPRRDQDSVFVVHRHEARRLHYDLRLEMDGVLKSWAIPKGFSYDPNVKHLAVHTEDHPLEYERFEGVIPKGAYGAGTMTIWDHGRYRSIKKGEASHGVGEGKLEIALFGRKLRGEWHLVRTNAAKDEWLIFKARDRYARSEAEPPPLFELGAARPAPFFDWVRPMEPAEVTRPFSDPGWIFEMRFRGRRLLAAKQADTVRLTDAGGRELTGRLSALAREMARIRAENALLDGSLVALDEGQRPSPDLLERLLKGDADPPLHYYAFDILYYEDWDLRELPLSERKALLASLIPKLVHLLHVDPVQGRGEDLFELTREAGLAGLIAKDSSSPYRSGPSPAWLEIPLHPPTKGSARVVDALGRAAPASSRRRFKTTNPDKLFWPEEGYTKGDLLSYYERVADVLLPYLQERPVHMLRYPDGLHGNAFYQKNAPEHVPDWIETQSIDSDSRGEPIRYIICNDRETLLYLINLGSIDLHPWLSRRDHRDTPDWAVIDLDPKNAPFADVVKIARDLGKLLRGIGLRPHLKTSGKTGLHIYIPLLLQYTYRQARTFCEAVARFVAKENERIATVERVVSQRGGKVYIDYLQNRQGQTVVPPYVARPVAGAPVSAPLDWDELDTELHPTLFTIKTMPARLSRKGDLFRPALTDQQDLRGAIERFQERYLR